MSHLCICHPLGTFAEALRRPVTVCKIASIKTNYNDNGNKNNNNNNKYNNNRSEIHDDENIYYNNDDNWSKNNSNTKMNIM